MKTDVVNGLLNNRSRCWEGMFAYDCCWFFFFNQTVAVPLYLIQSFFRGSAVAN